MLRLLTRLMLTGLITILPVMLTLYLIYWLVVSTEQALGGIIQLVLPDIAYWPGMGFLVAVILVFVVGLLMQLYVVKAVFKKVEDLLYHMPLVKSVYGAIRDFFHYFSPSREGEFQQVVAVKFENDMELIGFVTQANTDLLPTAEDDKSERVLVYLPMSYNIGGYPVMIPKSRLRPVDMTMEQAMRFVLTAGLTRSNELD